MKHAGLIALAAVAVSCGPPTNLLPVNDSIARPTSPSCASARFSRRRRSTVVPPVPLMVAPAEPGGSPGGRCRPATLRTSTIPARRRRPARLPSCPTAPPARCRRSTPITGSCSICNVDTGGYGAAPLGQLPAQISASDDGCQLISANRGSCDLTLVNPSVLVASTFQTETGGAVMPPSPRVASQTFRPIKGDGTVLTAPPYEAVFLPQDTSSLLPPPPTGGRRLPIQPQQLQMCGDSAAVGPVGWTPTAGQKSWPWYALVTYPSCDLITIVALPSGQIVSAAYVRATMDAKGNKTGVTLVDATTSPVCSSASCAGQALSSAPGVTSDAGLRSDAAATIDAPGPVQAEAGVADGSATAPDAGGGAAGAAGIAGIAGSTGAGGAPGTGGTPATAGASAAPMQGPPAARRAGRPWGTSTRTTPTSDRGRSAPAGSPSSLTPAGPMSRCRMPRSSFRSV